MYIAVLGPIATHELLSPAERQAGRAYPRGREGAPLVSNLIREYLRQGHRVLALTHDDALPDDGPAFVHESGNLTYVVVPCRHHTFRPNGRRPGRTADFFRFERRQLVTQLRRYQPEVVHAHWTYEYALAGLQYDPKALVTTHDNAWTIFRYVRTLNRFFHYLLARYVFWRGRHFTAVSSYTAGTVQPWARVPVQIVPNPVQVPPRTNAPRGPLAMPVISMVVNGWDDHKNITTALLAFKQVRQQHPQAELWGMGTAFEPGKQATVFCQRHNIEGVVLLGPTAHSQVLERVAASTLLLHTSIEESFGMALAEAMAYGVPVVAGQASGAVPWVVGPGGLLVDVHRPEAVAAAINQLLADPALYEQLAAQAATNVAERFPLAKVAGQYLALLQAGPLG